MGSVKETRGSDGAADTFLCSRYGVEATAGVTCG